MPYLEPALVLRRFSTFVREDVRAALDEPQDPFARAQVGSMSSTLEFLSLELEGMSETVDVQRRALEQALVGVEDALERSGDDDIRSAVVKAKRRVETAPRQDPYELEAELLTSSNDVLAAIDENLDGEAARIARRPMYEFLDTRVRSQLEMLGRDAE